MHSQVCGRGLAGELRVDTWRQVDDKRRCTWRGRDHVSSIDCPAPRSRFVNLTSLLPGPFGVRSLFDENYYGDFTFPFTVGQIVGELVVHDLIKVFERSTLRTLWD